MKTLTPLVAALIVAAQPLIAQTLADFQSAVSSQGPATYFKLDGALEDSVNTNLVLGVWGSTGVFGPDSFRNQGTARVIVNTVDSLFSDTDFIPGGGETNELASATGSIVMLFSALDSYPGGQRFILSQGNTSADGNALSLFMENNTSTNDPGSIKLRVGNGTHTLIVSNDVVLGAWYYFAMTYDEGRDSGEVKWYLGRQGGALQSATIDMGDDAVVGDNGFVYLGNNATLSAGYRDGTAPATAGRFDEVAVWNRELSQGEIETQFSKLHHPNPKPRAIYQGVVSGQSPKFYFKFDNDLVDSVSGTFAISATGTGVRRDYFGNDGGARFFSAGADRLVANTNLVNGGGVYNGSPGNGKGTISFLFRHLNYTNNSGQRFVFSAGGATGSSTIPGTNGLALLIENYTASSGGFGALKIRFGNGSKVILDPTDFSYSDWYYFAMTYDETLVEDQVTWYLGQPGGTLNSGVLSYAEGSLAGQGNIFVIGGHTNTSSSFSRTGHGGVDEFAIWHGTLSPAQIQAQFDAIENLPVAVSPQLLVTRSGANVILSWPVDGTAGFVLESTPTLTSPTWTAAGSPTVVGNENRVTNVIAPGNKFYRLRKP